MKDATRTTALTPANWGLGGWRITIIPQISTIDWLAFRVRTWKCASGWHFLTPNARTSRRASTERRDTGGLFFISTVRFAISESVRGRGSAGSQYIVWLHFRTRVSVRTDGQQRATIREAIRAGD